MPHNSFAREPLHAAAVRMSVRRATTVLQVLFTRRSPGALQDRAGFTIPTREGQGAERFSDLTEVRPDGFGKAAKRTDVS